MRIQEESSSSLMPRPPRAPKAAAGTESSSKLMLLSSIDIDTTANNNNNNNNCSSQGNGNGNGPSSCKSTGSGSTHFLDGFNVERCADVRSIPDPPTPQPRNHRHNHRHNHRRRSSPIVVGNRSSRHRLEDVTNNKNPPLSKRSRKSLCHVPAAGVEQRQEEEPQDNEPTNASAICLDDDVNDDVNDDDDDDDDLGHNKRRKKRQSMVLPKDLVEQHANAFASISHPKEQEEEEEDEALPQPSPNKKPKTTSTLFTGDWQSMKELQTMVRGYCASTGEQQPPQQPPQHAAAYFAKAIQDSTGYPLSKKKNTPSSSSSNSSPRSKDRKAILQQVYPVIQEMDKRKVEETAFWERETQCRVEKSRSGKYRYRLIATHEKVSSKEYERRYMAVLERNYANRLEKAEQWKARLVETEEEEDLSLELGSLLDPMPQQQQQQQRDDCISPLPIDSMEDDTMELCDLSASLDMGEATGFSFVDHDDDNNDDNKEETRTVSPEILEDQMIATAEQLERSETPTENEEREDVKPQSSSPPRSGVLLPDRKELERSEAPTENEEREDVKPQSSSPPRSGVLLPDRKELERSEAPTENEEREDVKPQSSSPPRSGVLLPLPDREEESRDPDIARAERKLWGRIDEALEEYSREVMLILESKKQTSNQQGE